MRSAEYRDGVLVSTEQIPDSPAVVNAATIRQDASAARATNKAYVALASPTNAQTTAQVKALSRAQNGLIRLLLAALDGTD